MRDGGGREREEGERGRETWGGRERGKKRERERALVGVYARE